MFKGSIMRNCLLFIMILLLVACSGKRPVSKVNIIDNIPTTVPQLPADVKLDHAAYTQKLFVDFSAAGVEVSAAPHGVDVSVNGSNVVLRSGVAGVEYVVRGSTGNGSLTIVSELSPLLTLDTLDIHSKGNYAMAVSSKEKIFIRGSVVALSDEPATGGVVDKQAAVLSLMGDAVFCGGVDICLQAARRDALRSTGIIYIDSAHIAVDYAAASAVNATKGVVLASGEFVGTALKDVVKIKQGNFIMLGGALTLGAAADKADAITARNIYLYDGVLTADVQGAAAKGLKSKESVFLLGGELKVHTSGGALFAEKKSDYSSSSCIKSSLNTYINGANVSLVSDGDAGKGINCDGLLQIDGGHVAIMTAGDDVNHPIDLNAHASAKGVKCDSTILINGGNIEILVFGRGTRCEGLESKRDIIIGGEDTKLYIYAYDDAINAGGNLTINDGKLFVYSVINDGIDSNGTIDINGGLVIANGSPHPEQGIDCDSFGDYTLRGGTVISLGGTAGPHPCMPENAATEAAVVAWNGVSVENGRYLNLSGCDGEVIFSYCLPCTMKNTTLVISSPQMEKGGEYTLFMSDSISGGEYAGCGFYVSAGAVAASPSVTWEQKELLSFIEPDGEVRHANPVTMKRERGVPPPPPPPHNPGAPFPPAGGVPPMGDVPQFPLHDANNLPCKGW